MAPRGPGDAVRCRRGGLRPVRGVHRRDPRAGARDHGRRPRLAAPATQARPPPGRSRTVPGLGVGDLATGIGLLWVVGAIRPASLPWAAIAVVSSACVFVASGILFHSAAFWLGRIEHLARQVWEFALTFSIYPR